MDKAFLVTGGTRGIGRAVAMRAAAAGHRVFVTGRDENALAQLRGNGIEGCRADVTEWDDVQAAVAAALERFGRIDVVVANAGIGAPGDLASGDVERWRETVLTNVFGVALTIRACLPALDQSRGRFVLIGSVTGRKHVPGSLYGATKWAVTGLGESLRLQMRETGVGVTVVEPGVVDTEHWADLSPPPVPLDKALTPDDVATAVLFAAEQPEHVDVNEILLRPKGQPL
jgi:NADP-dependent 3-hydroxy acid dehydrogenase YdfG